MQQVNFQLMIRVCFRLEKEQWPPSNRTRIQILPADLKQLKIIVSAGSIFEEIWYKDQINAIPESTPAYL